MTEGAYPDYTRVIPKESSASLRLGVNAVERLRNVAPMLQRGDELHTVHLHALDGKLMVMPENFENSGVAVEQPDKKEDRVMTDEKRNQVFKVTGEVKEENKVDSFEDLITAVGSVRLRVKELSDELIDLQKRLKESQRLQRQKDRDFKSARDLLGKLKKVSGF